MRTAAVAGGLVARARRTIRAAVLLGCVAALLTACSGADPLSEQYRSGTTKNYVAGDGSVLEIAQANRGASVEFSGTTQDGSTVGSADFLGAPLVVNFWYAACAPCRVEAADLNAIHDETAPKGVEFLGVNVRDGADTAKAFMKTFAVSYPTVIDQTDRSGGVLLAFSNYVAANTVPTTIVLDKQGRVAARISGLADPSTLRSLVDTVIAEK